MKSTNPRCQGRDCLGTRKRNGIHVTRPPGAYYITENCRDTPSPVNDRDHVTPGRL